MIGEAPHLLDPEVLDSNATADGKQRGLYYCPSSQGRSPESAAEFVDSIFEVPLSWPGPPVLRLFPLTEGISFAAVQRQQPCLLCRAAWQRLPAAQSAGGVAVELGVWCCSLGNRRLTMRPL